ncbi:hypothetical protein E4U42_006655 [Claviceps africana]|uniref:SprT-like domain-containing protein n=1 Tax=Claviceps africana TaxID=83212 RepID=A0A8K0JD90_9HYPO|nr:hypothetical protein E4U42_006655 [Claviceps africana]
MARLTRHSFRDDDTPTETDSSKHESQTFSDVRRENDAAAATARLKENLVLKPGTPMRSTHKIRRLGSTKQDTSILFQPWSRQDEDGSQARYQKIMRESPAKLGLFTEFEQDDTGVSPSKSSRWNRPELMCQTPRRSGKAIRKDITAGLLACRPSFAPQGTNDASLKIPARQHMVQEQDLIKDLVIDELAALESTITTTCSSSEVTTMSLSSSSNGIGQKDEDAPEESSISPSSTCLDFEDVGQDETIESIEAVTLDSKNNAHKRQDGLLDSRNDATDETKASHDEVDIVVEMWEKMHLASPPRSEKKSASDTDSSPSSSPRSGRKRTTTGSHPTLDDKQRQAQDLLDCCDSQESVPLSLPAPAVTDQKHGDWAKLSKKSLQAAKQSLAVAFLSELDEKVTKGRIAELTKATGGVQLNWTRSLNTTAGRANWRRETVRDKQSDGKVVHEEFRHHASIDLAEKVIDAETKLLNVLAHEFCHLATFMISGTVKNPHGKEFKTWAAKCSLLFGDRGIRVTTKHSYEIDFKYLWQCVSCHLEYKRHSKSIDVGRHRCGSCKGKLEQIRPAPRGSKNNDENPGQSPYQLFVRDQMQLVKRENPHVLQQDLMKIIAKKWAAQKGQDDVGSQVST